MEAMLLWKTSTCPRQDLSSGQTLVYLYKTQNILKACLLTPFTTVLQYSVNPTRLHNRTKTQHYQRLSISQTAQCQSLRLHKATMHSISPPAQQHQHLHRQPQEQHKKWQQWDTGAGAWPLTAQYPLHPLVYPTQ